MTVLRSAVFFQGELGWGRFCPLPPVRVFMASLVYLQLLIVLSDFPDRKHYTLIASSILSTYPYLAGPTKTGQDHRGASPMSVEDVKV